MKWPWETHIKIGDTLYHSSYFHVMNPMRTVSILCFRKIFLLVLIPITSSCFSQTEQISTWRFAENIGLRGVQIDFSGLYASNANYLLYEEKVLDKAYSDKAFQNIALSKNNNLREFSIYAVLLPFRHSNSNLMRKTEWQTGIGFFTTPIVEAIQFVVQGDSTSSAFYSRRIYGKMRSFDFTNRMLFETPTFSNTFKLFAGPTASFSMIPSFRLDASNSKVDYGIGEQHAELNDGFNVEMASFSYSVGAIAGIKFSLSCRWNLGIAYQYHWRQVFIKQGVQNYSRNGFNLSLRYKFVRPDESGNAPDNINTGPFW